MLRKRRSKRDILIDLTSLLDVIFIILFIVVQNSTITTSHATDEAATNAANAASIQEALTTTQSELDSTRQELAQSQASAASAQNEANALRNEISTETLGNLAAVVTISLSYDIEKSSTRYVDARGGGFEMNQIVITPDNETTSWSMLRRRLGTFINEKASDQTPVIITYDREGGLHRDYISLSDVLDELHETYNNLYLK